MVSKHQNNDIPKCTLVSSGKKKKKQTLKHVLGDVALSQKQTRTYKSQAWCIKYMLVTSN